eukprot:6214443-Pleurochrysis_carterae.AAC.1
MLAIAYCMWRSCYAHQPRIISIEAAAREASVAASIKDQVLNVWAVNCVRRCWCAHAEKHDGKSGKCRVYPFTLYPIKRAARWRCCELFVCIRTTSRDLLME